VEVVLYIGGSRNGEKSVLPYGFSKTRVDTQHGPEIYIQRLLSSNKYGVVPVMILENLHEDTASTLLNQYLN